MLDDRLFPSPLHRKPTVLFKSFPMPLQSLQPESLTSFAEMQASRVVEIVLQRRATVFGSFCGCFLSTNQERIGKLDVAFPPSFRNPVADMFLFAVLCRYRVEVLLTRTLLLVCTHPEFLGLWDAMREVWDVDSSEPSTFTAPVLRNSGSFFTDVVDSSIWPYLVKTFVRDRGGVSAPFFLNPLILY